MDPRLSLFDLIGVLARRRYQMAERSFAALGLNHTEARLMTLLHRAGGSVAQDVLSSQIFVDRSNAGRALKRLEREGYVGRQRGDEDKRTNLVEIRAKGQEVVAEIARLRQEMAHAFFGDLTEEQAAVALDLLRRAKVSEDGAKA